MASEAGNKFTQINLSCFCKQITASANVPIAELPLPLSLCHCDTCRHHTGTLSYTTFSLSNGSSQLEVKGKPKCYKPFKAKAVERFFCDNCGTMVYENSPDGRTFLCAGAMTKAEGITKLHEQIFVGDTKDGGSSVWFPKVKSWEAWDGKSPEYDVEETVETSITKIKVATEPEKLLCYCNCKGVQFTIKPASSLPKDKIEQLRLQDSGTKYLASFCVCNDCRIANGHDLQPWAYVPDTSIEKLDGSAVDFSQDGKFDLGTAKQYKSSEEARREFCGECGATLFWHAFPLHDSGRLDVSVGLMAAESGARAEEWLSWRTERVSHRGLEQKKELIEHLVEGLKWYGEKRAKA